MLTLFIIYWYNYLLNTFIPSIIQQRKRLFIAISLVVLLIFLLNGISEPFKPSDVNNYSDIANVIAVKNEKVTPFYRYGLLAIEDEDGSCHFEHHFICYNEKIAQSIYQTLTQKNPSQIFKLENNRIYSIVNFDSD